MYYQLNMFIHTTKNIYPLFVGAKLKLPHQVACIYISSYKNYIRLHALSTPYKYHIHTVYVATGFPSSHIASLLRKPSEVEPYTYLSEEAGMYINQWRQKSN